MTCLIHRDLEAKVDVNQVLGNWLYMVFFCSVCLSFNSWFAFQSLSLPESCIKYWWWQQTLHLILSSPFQVSSVWFQKIRDICFQDFSKVRHCRSWSSAMCVCVIPCMLLSSFSITIKLFLWWSNCSPAWTRSAENLSLMRNQDLQYLWWFFGESRCWERALLSF